MKETADQDPLPLLLPTHDPRRGPPAAPEIPRELRFTKRQWLGMPLLFAIPILALAGVFGEHTTEQDMANSAFAVHLTYPDRVHYRQQTMLRLSVRNLGVSPVDTVTVTFDTTYMRAFTGVRLSPAERQTYVVALTDIAPRETRLVVADLAGDQAGRYRGVLTVASPTDTLRLQLSTIVFP